ncbi:MAG: DUF945 family protein [Gammaproteobacteria bacterium]|nr:DUF945 family protein [Gammaproteobacteria bacterium]
MKRILTAVLVLVVIVAAALPPLFGARARSLIEAELASIGEAVSSHATVEVSFHDWDVGWFSSTASVSLGVELNREALELDGQDPQALSTTLKLVTLYHGPVLIEPLAGLGWGAVELVVDASLVPELRDFHEAAGVDHVARLGVLVGLSSTTIGMDMPAFVYEEAGATGQGVGIDFGGLEATVVFDGRGESLEFDGEVGGVGITTPGWNAEVGRASWASNAREDARIPELWLGGGQVDVARVMVSSGDGGLVEVNDIRLQGGTEIDGDDLVATYLYEAREAVITTTRLDELAAEASVRYGYEALARLMEAVYNLEALDEEQQMALINALVRERLTFAIDRLGFEHEDRAALASLQIDFRGAELPDWFDISRSLDLSAILPWVSADVDLVFHRDLLNGLGIGQMDALVRILAREGMVKESGDDYTLNVGFEDGTLTVNGEPVEPFELLGLLSGL